MRVYRIALNQDPLLDVNNFLIQELRRKTEKCAKIIVIKIDEFLTICGRTKCLRHGDKYITKLPIRDKVIKKYAL